MVQLTCWVPLVPLLCCILLLIRDEAVVKGSVLNFDIRTAIGFHTNCSLKYNLGMAPPKFRSRMGNWNGIYDWPVVHAMEYGHDDSNPRVL